MNDTIMVLFSFNFHYDYRGEAPASYADILSTWNTDKIKYKSKINNKIHEHLPMVNIYEYHLEECKNGYIVLIVITESMDKEHIPMAEQEANCYKGAEYLSSVVQTTLKTQKTDMVSLFDTMSI